MCTLTIDQLAFAAVDKEQKCSIYDMGDNVHDVIYEGPVKNIPEDLLYVMFDSWEAADDTMIINVDIGEDEPEE